MKKTFMSILASVLALVIVSALLYIPALAESGICGKTLAWSYSADTKTLTINGSGAMYDYINAGNTPWAAFKDDIIAVKVNDKVTVIGDYAFAGMSKLENVTLGAAVTAIGDSAFIWDASLSGVVLPETVSSIGDGAFFGCEKLTELAISASVRTIGRAAFAESGLTSIELGKNVTSVADSLFENCASLSSVTMSEKTKKIGDYAFFGCKALTEIAIPESVAEIGVGAFNCCDTLTAINAAAGTYASVDGVLFRGDALVAYPTAKQGEYTVPESVCEIAPYAFFGSSVTKLTLGKKITVFGSSAFASCKALTDISAPSTLEKNASVVFEGCDAKITYYKVASLIDLLPEGYSAKDGMLFGASIKTVAEDLGTGEDVVYYDKNGDGIDDNTLIGTGFEIALVEDGVEADRLTFVVMGDVDGDAEITAKDCVLVKKAFLGTTVPEGAYSAAMMVDGGETVSAADYLIIKRVFLGTYTLG